MSDPRILYISSANFSRGPGAIAWTHVSHLREEGYDVDVLTLNYQVEHPDFLCVYGRSIISRIKRRINYFIKSHLRKKLPESPYFFYYKDELNPPVSVNSVLRRIKKPYDLVIIYFWQEMLSFKTVEAIYDRLNNPIVFFLAADYSHMSGGCHFTGGCQRYQIGCGCCPAFNSHDENDFTHRNVVYRQRFYKKVRPIIVGSNSYMMSFYKKSFLIKDAIFEKGVPGFDSSQFHPIDKGLLRTKYNISNEVNFIIGFGCQKLTDPRKGVSYLIEALNKLYCSLTDENKRNILVVSIGASFEEISTSIPFQSLGLGTIPYAELSEFYSLLDIFVCSSVDDAGPSMVLQSISCGTPVVGFEMSAVLDYVKGKGTGYCAKMKDADDLVNGMDKYFRLTVNERQAVSKKCRDIVVNEYKYSKKIQSWINIYHKYAGG